MKSHRALVMAMAAALSVTTGALQTAHERATFVLADGDRVTGDVVFQTDARTNIHEDGRAFTVDTTDANAPVSVPVDAVAVIDFAGGRPRADELRTIPIDGHTLVLRTGETRRGRLIDLIHGDTVRWELEHGGTIDISIADVRRVYLQGDRARQLFNFRERPVAPSSGANAPLAAGAGSAGVGRGRGTPSDARLTIVATVTVPGTEPWTETAINVRRGDILVFEPSGKVAFQRQGPASATADGHPSHYDQSLPVSDAPAGALIAKVGPEGDPFMVGAAGSEIGMPATGVLHLGINDRVFADNSGGFEVRIRR